MAAYFASLRPHSQPALLSNSFAGARGKEQEPYHFAEMYDLLMYSHEEGIAKAKRRIFELLCERLGVQSAEVVFLDDVEANAAAARACGIQAILFRATNEAIAAVQACLQAFPALDLDTDNGAEFINEEVLAYCTSNRSPSPVSVLPRYPTFRHSLGT